nr:uncharacterized protein LOC100178024 isoform X1 [Ciona intestinalis]|eukprot:XP_002128229.1 uncharacterized protein LOC100178024 isoform X1 [Ciona intestinalis]
MREVIIIILMTGFYQLSSGIRCWTCSNQPTMFDCIMNGDLRTCRPGQDSCETIQRRWGSTTIIMKGCKQTEACLTDARVQVQLDQRGERQCNGDRTNSVCTCCCDTNRCNLNSRTCRGMQFDCNLPPSVANSRAVCSMGNSPGSACRYQCDADYSIHPFESQILNCLIDGTWDRPAPCCAKICPPYLNRDILTLKQSRNLNSWVEFKAKLVTLYGHFSVQNDSARVGLISYGNRVHNELTIQLSDFIEDRLELLTKISILPYRAGGDQVNTGAVLLSVVEKYFGLNQGDRPLVPNIVIVHADDVSSDDVLEPAETLRNLGFATYAIASSSNNNTEYHQQMSDIAGHPSRLFYESDVTDIGFIEELVLSLCSNVCT